MKKDHISNNILLQIGFLAIIVLLFSTIIFNLISFLPGFLGALCLYILLLSPFKWMVYKKNINKYVSSILLILVLAILVLSPLFILIQMLSGKIMNVLSDTTQVKLDIRNAIETVRTRFNIDVFSENNIGKITQIGINLLDKTINTSFNMMIQLGVSFLVLYFMLINHKALNNWFYKNIPFKKENLEKMNKSMKTLVISNTVGIPVTALFQAIIAYLGYIIFGVDDTFTWFILTAFAAMIPIVGAAIIYIPLVIIFLSRGETTSAIGLLLYCVIIVGASDNLIRFVLQKKIANIHPLITIFGVVVGINLFGFIGIIFGPILFSLLIWLVKLYRFEFIDPYRELKS